MLSNSESDSILFGLVKVAEANIFLFAFNALKEKQKLNKTHKPGPFSQLYENGLFKLKKEKKHE